MKPKLKMIYLIILKNLRKKETLRFIIYYQAGKY